MSDEASLTPEAAGGAELVLKALVQLDDRIGGLQAELRAAREEVAGVVRVQAQHSTVLAELLARMERLERQAESAAGAGANGARTNGERTNGETP